MIRKTPMKRSQIRRRTTMRKRSKHLAQRTAHLVLEYQRVFAEPQRCAWCGRFGADSPHHTTEKRRNGDGLFFWVPVHEIPCHREIHANPKLAAERKMLDVPWEDRTLNMVHIPNPDFLDDDDAP